MSGQLEKDPGERKLRVTLLSAEWKTSRNGDVTTINRELAKQMAKHPNVEVSVFLPQCSEEDKKSADSKYNVKLIEAIEMPGFKPVDWLASVPDGHVMDCVVGHGVALGRQIQLIKKNPNYSHCKWIQVVHSAPEEIGMYKNISKGQQMQEDEIELCKKADQVVAIGPKLTDKYKHQLNKQDVFNLTPSIFSEFSDVQQASDERKTFCVLVIESGDHEDFDAKGYEIAAKAIANLQDKSYQLMFASKQSGKEDEIVEKLLQCGIGRNQLIVRSFDENRETLANLFCEADIVLLPSRTEGFGLSALQAISAGLPLLVSENSGIAEALRGVPNGSDCIVVDSECPTKWARAIQAVRDKARNVRLAEAKDLCAKYFRVYSWDEPCCFLVKKMTELVFGGSGDTRNENHKAPSSSNLHTVKKGKSQVSEQVSDPVPDPGSVEVILLLQQMQLNASQVNDNTDLNSELKKIASDRGFIIADNEGLGNCMFYALSNQLEIILGIKIKPDELRQVLVQYLRKNPILANGTNLSCFIYGHQSWNDYLMYMGQDGAWGDHVILCAAANCYKTCIRVVSSLSTARDIILEPECPVDKSKTLVLGHIHEVHYVSLLSTQGGSGDTRNEKHKAPSSSNLYTVKTGKSQVSEQVSDPVPDPGNTRNKKPKAPCSSNLYSVKKGKSQVSEQASDPVPDAAASLRTSDSAFLSTLLKSVLSPPERTKTQSVPLPATQTSDNKGGVPIETKGWNSLHTAAESGNEGIIEILLSSGLDIDSRGNDGTTPLMVAAAAGKEETVNLLLQHEADPLLKGKDGWSLLHVAAQSGNVAIIDTMLSKGLNIDSRGETLGLTPLLVSLKNDKLEAAKHLIEKGANVSLKFHAGMNALSIAVVTGSVAAIKMLLSHGLCIDSRDAAGNTPLLMAAGGGKEEIVNLLLTKGADPHLKNYIGRNLLHAAAEGGNTSIVERMLSYDIDIDSRDDECNSATSLIIATMFNNVEVMKYLLEKGANLSLTTGSTRRNVLHIASQYGSVAAIQLLLSTGLSLDSRDSGGNTPLACAAACGQIEAVNCLLEHGADPSLKGQDGWSLLHFAAQSGNVTIIDTIIDTMLSKGLNIDSRGETVGLTPLLVSLSKGNLEAANYLLKRGADEHMKGKEGLTALSAAAISGNVAAIEMLVNRGHDPNSRDGCDKTPIMWAVESGKQAAVEYLLPLTHKVLLPTTD